MCENALAVGPGELVARQVARLCELLAEWMEAADADLDPAGPPGVPSVAVSDGLATEGEAMRAAVNDLQICRREISSHAWQLVTLLELHSQLAADARVG